MNNYFEQWGCHNLRSKCCYLHSGKISGTATQARDIHVKRNHLNDVLADTMDCNDSYSYPW